MGWRRARYILMSRGNRHQPAMGHIKDTAWATRDPENFSACCGSAFQSSSRERNHYKSIMLLNRQQRPSTEFSFSTQVEEKESVKVMLVAGMHPGWGGIWKEIEGCQPRSPSGLFSGIPQTPASYVLYPICTMRLGYNGP